MAEESNQGENEKPPEQPAAEKIQTPFEVQEQKLSPKPSFWPLALAIALVIAGIGIMVSTVVFVCGVVLAIVAAIGWALEKH